MNYNYFKLLLITITCLFCVNIYCTLNIAGSVTEGGNVEIAGVITDSLDNPLKGARITLRPQDYVKSLSQKVKLSRMFSADTITDKNGYFKIGSLMPGEYCIEAATQDSLLGAVIKIEAYLQAEKDTHIILPKTIVKPTSNIKGTIINQSIENKPIFVQVYGLERIAMVDSINGEYQLRALPEGTYKLQVSIESPKYSPLILPEIKCEKGESKTLDTILIAPFEEENYALWNYSKKILLNTTSDGIQINSDLINFPVLIRLREPDFDFSQFLSDGHDVRFSNIHGTHLPFEIDRFDPYSKIADIWVLVDTVKANDSNIITMYWGNSIAAMHSLSSKVFDTSNSFVGVWHLNQRGLNERIDATQNKLNAVTQGYEGDEWTYGLFGGCDSIDDNDDKLEVVNIPHISALTISMWINSYELSSSGRQFCISKVGTSNKPPVYSLMINEKQQLAMNITVNNKPDSIAFGSVSLNEWYFIAGSYDGNNMNIYLNGELIGSKVISGKIDTVGNILYIGSFDKNSQKLHGKFDEVRIMKNAVSSDWIKLSYENQKPNSTFIKFLQ